ncbi:hypothetical protein Ancab_024837 [Ancistrocladus abbreviatus]
MSIVVSSSVPAIYYLMKRNILLRLVWGIFTATSNKGAVLSLNQGLTCKLAELSTLKSTADQEQRLNFSALAITSFMALVVPLLIMAMAILSAFLLRQSSSHLVLSAQNHLSDYPGEVFHVVFYLKSTAVLLGISHGSSKFVQLLGQGSVSAFSLSMFHYYGVSSLGTVECIGTPIRCCSGSNLFEWCTEGLGAQHLIQTAVFVLRCLFVVIPLAVFGGIFFIFNRVSNYRTPLLAFGHLDLMVLNVTTLAEIPTDRQGAVTNGNQSQLNNCKLFYESK